MYLTQPLCIKINDVDTLDLFIYAEIFSHLTWSKKYKHEKLEDHSRFKDDMQ